MKSRYSIPPVFILGAAMACASAGPAVKRANPAGLSRPTGYTHVVEAAGGRTVYISGQVALDSAGNLEAQDRRMSRHVPGNERGRAQVAEAESGDRQRSS